MGRMIWNGALEWLTWLYFPLRNVIFVNDAIRYIHEE